MKSLQYRIAGFDLMQFIPTYEKFIVVEIKDESAESIIKGNEITFAKEHLAQFASFGYGALRGVMYLKTINTPIDNVILPPLDLMDLFSTPLTISF